MRAEKGTPPSASQNGLKETLRTQNYLLSCICKPTEDMTVSLAGEEVRPTVKATLLKKESLNAEVFRLLFKPHTPFPYRAGQFVQLHRPDGLIRSYSLASLPDKEDLLELHVRRLPEGAMTRWLTEEIELGTEVTVSGPSGDCFYLEGQEDTPLLLIGTGTGLAPLWGIVRDALQRGHRADLFLYHGSWTPEGLYLVSDLQRLAEQSPRFHYIPCVDENPLEGYQQGRADKIALTQHPNLKQWRVFLCGHPGMVATAKRQAYLAGASLKDIFADPFVLSTPPP
jgi:NAD(P)H-flavin reductase